MASFCSIRPQRRAFGFGSYSGRAVDPGIIGDFAHNGAGQKADDNPGVAVAVSYRCPQPPALQKDQMV